MARNNFENFFIVIGAYEVLSSTAISSISVIPHIVTFHTMKNINNEARDFGTFLITRLKFFIVISLVYL